MRSQTIMPDFFPWMPRYKGGVHVKESSSVWINGAWSEGCRTLHQCINPETGRELPLPEMIQQHPDTFPGIFRQEYPTQPGLGYLEIWQRGDKKYPSLILHPDDYQRLVEEKMTCLIHEECRKDYQMGRACYLRGDSILEERLLKILATIRSLKSGSYRNQELAKLKVVEEDYRQLIEAGFLSRNKGGHLSLTPAGRIISSSH